MIEAGQIYKHTKRGTSYKVISVAQFQCDTYPNLDYKRVVVCVSVLDDNEIWTRLEEEFLGEVEINGESTKRFELVS